jgi:hypothetical protein
MKFLRVAIFTAIERNEAIAKAREVIDQSGGWISSHTLLSNLAATINFELPLNRAMPFIQKLNEVGFQPKVEGAMPKSEDGDLRGQLTLTFVHHEPDLKREVPAFG